MSNFANQQEQIDEIIDNLNSYATGDYLQVDEKEFWDQPFDPAVLPELRALLEGFITKLDAVVINGTGESTSDIAGADETDFENLDPALQELVGGLITAITAFNARYEDAVVEPEEQEDIYSFIRGALEVKGVYAGQLPEFGE